ncbi:MAG: phosphoribosylanthranilate isomerase [Alphaproteobacteria bacterium]|nr:phosphoribosylanthranilate isomerase [Alphaproteobacteria bacterium]
MVIAAKICGLSDASGVDAAVEGGAAFVGFVFFPQSPRHVEAPLAAGLMHRVPPAIVKTGLFVDPTDAYLAEILHHAPLDLIQLHGKETPARAAFIRKHFQKPVMKALALGVAEDLKQARTYEGVVDRLLFDAPPPQGATRPGGNASSFNWSLLKGQHWSVPWMLAGGLTPENLADAVSASGARAVDVSSGVEEAPGRKSPEKIAAFLRIAATL